MDELTPKQGEVVRLMAKGLTNAQIGERMGVSLAGAKWHVSEVISKLGVSSREEAVVAWQAQRSIGARVRALVGLFSLPKVAAGSAVVGAGGAVAGVAVMVGTFGAGDGGRAIAMPDETREAASTETGAQVFDVRNAWRGMQWDEFEASVDAAVGCIEDAGIEIHEQPHLEARGTALEYSVQLTGDTAEDERIRGVAMDCERAHEHEAKLALTLGLGPGADR